MNLNHINLVASNVPEALKLFETYFSFKHIETKGDNRVAILKGENGFTLVIIKDKGGQARYPEAFHLGFMLDTEEAVWQTYHLLKNDGLIAGQEPRKIRDSFGFYFHYDNMMIEVGHYLD